MSSSKYACLRFLLEIPLQRRRHRNLPKYKRIYIHVYIYIFNKPPGEGLLRLSSISGVVKKSDKNFFLKKSAASCACHRLDMLRYSAACIRTTDTRNETQIDEIEREIRRWQRRFRYIYLSW